MCVVCVFENGIMEACGISIILNNKQASKKMSAPPIADNRWRLGQSMDKALLTILCLPNSVSSLQY